MALSESIVIGKIEIFDDGQIQLRQDRVIVSDGDEVARTFKRRVLNPGDDVSAQPARVRAICTLLWTPAVIAAYQAAKAANAIG